MRATSSPRSRLVKALRSLRKALAVTTLADTFPDSSLRFLAEPGEPREITAARRAKDAVAGLVYKVEAGQVLIDESIGPPVVLRAIERVLDDDVGYVDRFPAEPLVLQKLDGLIKRLAQRKTRDYNRGASESVLPALLAHHRYDQGVILNVTPISLPELDATYHVKKAVASRWFRANFGGHQKYKAACCQNRGRRLKEKLKQMNDDYALFGQGATDNAKTEHDDNLNDNENE